MPGLFFDTMERSDEGPRMAEEDFDLNLAKRTKELVKKYEIKFDPEHVVNEDDAMADRLFEAAMELAAETGLWCLDTQRVAKFSKAEIMRFLETINMPIWVGHGKDQVLLEARKPESTKRALVLGGAAGSGMTEGEIYVKHMMNFAMEPTVDMISQGNPEFIEGRPVRPFSPIEVHGAIQEVAWVREGIRRSGRPGMPLFVAPGCAASAGPAIAVINEDRGMRKGDFIFAVMLTELKTDYDRLARAVAAVENELHVVTLYAPVIGGWAGGPEGAALVGTAECILAGIAYNSTIVVHHPIHMFLKSGATTRRDTMWMESISGQAMSRNTVFPMAQNVFLDSRPGTKTCLYEAAANAIVAVTSGQHTGPGTSGIIGGGDIDMITGVEVRMMGETSRSVTAMPRAIANEIVLKCVEKYEPTEGNQAPGKRMQDLYDVKRLKPHDEWLQMFEEVKKDLTDWGVPYKF
jgi:methylamine---corrinoid protein Co-methyltransferase